MKTRPFFYVESVQTWVNMMHIEQVYNVNGWNILMQSGKRIKLKETEYVSLVEAFAKPEREKDKPKEEKTDD